MHNISEQRLFIHGQQVDATSSETFSNFSPSTGDLICQVQSSSIGDVEAAVVSAEKGFREWSSLSPTQRGRILAKAAKILREKSEFLAQLEVLDTGKPIAEALSTDIPSAADALEYFAGVAPTLHGSHYDLGGSFVYTRREPLGVCAGIGAWNYPLQIACWKSAPALACGNSMIFKSSELTPLTALQLAEIYREAGLPAGVFNVLQGSGQVGKALASHPRIRKISLTGSVATGKKVMELASDSLKQMTLELGGKSPLILFEDCDLDQAVDVAIAANFYTQGEICSNATRIFVQDKIYRPFIERLVPKIKKIRVGDPFDPSTQMGALISRHHLDKVLSYIRMGVQEGAILLSGGKQVEWNQEKSHLNRGNFVEPTVFTECKDEMTHVREEIFGPVMSILRFQDEEEVIQRANQTPYGLAAGVFSSNIQKAHRVVASLQAGTCWINNYNITPVEIPFGGYKQSGLGRENGLAALEYYTQLKTVYVEMGKVLPTF